MKKILIASLVLLFIIPLVNAQTCTISVEDPIYDSTTADVGDTRTVSVTAKCSASSATASLSMVTSTESGTGTLTAITDTGASRYESVSITTSGVTKTFTVSASASGSYSFYIKATTSDGGGAQSSTQYIQYVDPSSFAMTIDEDPSGTYAASTKVGVVITFHNLLTTPQTRNITLWFSHPSTTGTGDPLSWLVTLQGGESSQLIWNVTPVYASPSYAHVRLGSNEQSTTFTFNQQTSGDGTTDGGGGGGAGGGAAAGALVKIKHTFKELKKNTIEKWKINQPGMGLIEMNITVRNPANDVQISIEKLEGKPLRIVHEITGKVYQYIEINKTNLTDNDIDKIHLKINVNKSWITVNGIDETTVALNRYNNGVWEKLPTTKVEEDNDYVYYVAEMTGLSVFAITGEVKPGATTIATTTETTAATTAPISGEITAPIPYMAGISYTTWALVVILIVIGAVFVWVYYKKPKIM